MEAQDRLAALHYLEEVLPYDIHEMITQISISSDISHNNAYRMQCLRISHLRFLLAAKSKSDLLRILGKTGNTR